MPRPKTKGRVCKLPEINIYGPLISDPNKREEINLSIEEYESMRIIDFMHASQKECAKEMGIARTTLQHIYYRAKEKVADAIVNGKLLKIEGGNYKLCKKDIQCFDCDHCIYNDRKI